MRSRRLLTISRFTQIPRLGGGEEDGAGTGRPCIGRLATQHRLTITVFMPIPGHGPFTEEAATGRQSIGRLVIQPPSTTTAFMPIQDHGRFTEEAGTGRL